MLSKPLKDEGNESSSSNVNTSPPLDVAATNTANRNQVSPSQFPQFNRNPVFSPPPTVSALLHEQGVKIENLENNMAELKDSLKQILAILNPVASPDKTVIQDVDTIQARRLSGYYGNDTPYVPRQSNFGAESSSSNSFGSSVKLPPPEIFYGKIGTKSMILLSFITQMEVYLGAAKVALDSSSSLQLAVLRLKENALNWYVAVSTRDSNMIKSWSELKEQLKKRYLPQSQDQLSLNDLLEIRYKGNIETYNNAFSDVLMLIPGLAGGDEKTEQLAMGIYAKGISAAGTSLHLASAVQTAISRKEVKTMIDLMSIAQLAEQTWKMSNPGRYGKLHVAFQHGNSSASSSRPAFPNRFERPQGTPNKSFNTSSEIK